MAQGPVVTPANIVNGSGSLTNSGSGSLTFSGSFAGLTISGSNAIGDPAITSQGLFLASAFLTSEATPDNLRFYISSDGKTFNQIGAGLYKPSTGGLRDPSWIYFNNKYWVVSTSGSNGTVPYFNLITSTDLNSWVSSGSISTSSLGSVSNTWAPEWYQDPNTSAYTGLHVFFAANISAGNFKLYETHPTTADLAAASWSAPIAITGTSLPSSIIDPFLINTGTTWEMWYKNNSTNFQEVMSSTTSATTGYNVVHSGNWATFNGNYEGESLAQVDASTWRIWMDSGTNIFWADSTDSRQTWTALTQINSTTMFQHPTVKRTQNYITQTNAYAVVAQSGTAHWTKLQIGAYPSNMIPTGSNELEILGSSSSVGVRLRTVLTGNAAIYTDPDNFGNNFFLTGRGVGGTDYFETLGGTQNILFFGKIQMSLGKSLQIAGGANALSGTFTMSSGAATVTSTALTNSMVVQLTQKTSSGAAVYPNTVIGTGSFVATGAATDNGTYLWWATLVNQ